MMADIAAEQEHYFTERMAACQKAWEDGNPRGASRAFDLCGMFDRGPPPWLRSAIKSQLAQLDSTGKTGRHARSGTRERDLAKHFARWDAVLEFRERKKLGELADVDYPGTWEGAYPAVSELLEGTPFAGGEDTVEKSYKLVQRLMRQGKAGRFFVG